MTKNRFNDKLQTIPNLSYLDSIQPMDIIGKKRTIGVPVWYGRGGMVLPSHWMTTCLRRLNSVSIQKEDHNSVN